MLPANFVFKNENWKDLQSTIPVSKPNDPKKLGFGDREYQIRAFEAFKNKQNTILIAPTGSGKSVTQIFCATREILESDYTQKQVFVVPQLTIGHGFTQHKNALLDYEGEILNWKITVNCCPFEGTNKSSVSKIKNFLLSKPTCNAARKNREIGGCTAVVSYAALLLAWKSMTEDQKLFAIKNTSFRIDETHHVSGEINQLGSFCNFVLKNGGSLHLITATFFRGDCQEILGGDYLQEFEIFRVPFLEHFDTLNLKSLHIGYVCYNTDQHLFSLLVEKIKKDIKEHHLIIVPSDGHKYFKSANKFNWISNLVSELKYLFGDSQVLDLVSKETQNTDKNKFLSENQNFKIVVTCIIGKEGIDWPACSRIHNTALDASVLNAIQKLGRALREHPEKQDVIMYNYIQHFNSWDSENTRIRLSDMFNAVMGSSMLDDMFYPLHMPALPKNKNEIKNNTEKKTKITLEDLYGAKRGNVIETLISDVLALDEKSRSENIINAIIEAVIENFKEDTLYEVEYEILKQRLLDEVIRRLHPERLDLRVNSSFIREAGYDKVTKELLQSGSPFIAEFSDREQLQKILQDNTTKKLLEIKEIGIPNLIEGSELHKFLNRVCRWYKKTHGV